MTSVIVDGKVGEGNGKLQFSYRPTVYKLHTMFAVYLQVLKHLVKYYISTLGKLKESIYLIK